MIQINILDLTGYNISFFVNENDYILSLYYKISKKYNISISNQSLFYLNQKLDISKKFLYYNIFDSHNDFYIYEYDIFISIS